MIVTTLRNGFSEIKIANGTVRERGVNFQARLEKELMKKIVTLSLTLREQSNMFFIAAKRHNCEVTI